MGWINASGGLLERPAAAGVHESGGCVSQFGGSVVARLLASGGYDQHVTGLSRAGVRPGAGEGTNRCATRAYGFLAWANEHRATTSAPWHEEADMAKAVRNGAVLTASEHTEMVESNHYFPQETVRREYLRPNDEHTVCPRKSQASYFDVEVEGQVNRGAAWYYPAPKEAAQSIKDHVAFLKRVDVSD